MPSTITKIFSSSSAGDSSEFKSIDNELTYKVVVSGTPAATLDIFLQEQTHDVNIKYIKYKCSDWGTASAEVHCKSSHADDDFSSVGDTPIASNSLEIFDY